MKYGFDDIVAISKDAVDKITGKANEAVNVSKAYVERAQLRVKLKERYYELGRYAIPCTRTAPTKQAI